MLEAWINRVPADIESPEMKLFLRFIRTLGGLTAFRTEWMIYGEEERLAGSIDFVAEDRQGDLVIFDWKRSKDRRCLSPRGSFPSSKRVVICFHGQCIAGEREGDSDTDRDV